ncbi:hypothetical protein Gogos_021545 [Gossypium gossypioides]|uniref:Uncharacterized protein n=1 Tax=Gossypium gossypioides TaxID=34282 RepID=A0A7J9D1K8_GOSGO|nr:hypothetical protein [Gossypium gossypioides]
MIGSPRLSAVKEDREHLKKNIDKCYNNPRYYQTQTEIDLMKKAQYLLHQQIYKLWTDGRRILAYDTGNIQNDRDEESLRLLKKILEMEIEDFPSHIIEEIRSTWETWNSSPRLSLNSLHLDDIEEINLDNIQEG